MEDTKPPDREGMAEAADRFRVMELRSGCLVRRSPPPRRVRSRRGPCGGADDRLSALPDDMLLVVLARLRCARNAARTGILSRRWRGLWTNLPDLTFCDVAPIKIEAVLARLASSPTVPATLDIDIPLTDSADEARLARLLDAVVRFSPRELCFSDQFYMEAADLHLPCFPHATSIEIRWGANICFTQLPSGEFSALERLTLEGTSVIGIDTLVTCCPCLRMLRVIGPTSDIKVHSVSLQTLVVISVDDELCISSIDIVTPKLKQLKLILGADTNLSVSISAPMLLKVVWKHWFRETTHLFGFWHLGRMFLRPADRFLDGDYWLPSVNDLSLDIWAIDQLGYELDMAHEVEFAQEMEKLPVINFSVLELFIQNGGHVFGALVWRLLGLHQSFAATKRLIVDIARGRRTCSEDCPCDQPKNWRGQSISLTRLEEVHLKYFTGEDHQHDFLTLIFRSSPMLNKVTLKLVPEFGGCTKKIYNTFSAYPDVKGFVYFSSGELVPQPCD